MAQQQAAAANPADIVPFKETHSKLPRYFPRGHGGVDWMYRMHRQRFVEAGAVLEIGGRLFTDVPVFERVVISIGRETLARRHGVKPPT